jgi:hypothetical protein
MTRDKDQLHGLSCSDDLRREIEDRLGLMPRAALRALVDYALNDSDIAQYHEMPSTLVSDLRAAWGIAPARDRITDKA